jgi:serine protease Do
VQSCIHCHMIGDAQRALDRGRKQPIPEQVLFSYPHPKTLGLILDPRERATVLRAEPSSPAEQAGFKKGDVIVKLEGQPLLSIADVQWVLQQASPEGASLKAQVRRGDGTAEVTLTLPGGWRHGEDISWRASSWGLRRMATGGLLVEELPAEAREKAGLAEGAMALRVKHVGQFGPHAAAKQAGFREGDVVVSFDGRTDLRRETDVLAYAVTNHKPGERVPVTVLRDGKKIDLTLPMQE